MMKNILIIEVNIAQAKREKEKEELRLKKEKQKEIAKELLSKMVAEGLDNIKEGSHRGEDVLRFLVVLDGFCSFMFHAYKEDTEELIRFYKDLKNKNLTEKTKDFYMLCAYICSDLVVDNSSISSAKDFLWKDFNIKQFPLTSAYIKSYF